MIMDTPKIEERVLKIIAEAAGDAQADEIAPSATLVDELSLDSLRQHRCGALVMTVEAFPARNAVEVVSA